MKKILSQIEKTKTQGLPVFVLYSNEFGFDMFLADRTKSTVEVLTDTQSEALEIPVCMVNNQADIVAHEINKATGYNFTVKYL